MINWSCCCCFFVFLTFNSLECLRLCWGFWKNKIPALMSTRGRLFFHNQAAFQATSVSSKNLPSEIQNEHWLQLWYLRTGGGGKSISHLMSPTFRERNLRQMFKYLCSMGNAMLYIIQLFIINSQLLIYYILGFFFGGGGIFIRKSGQNPSQRSCTLWMNLNNTAPPYQMIKTKKLSFCSFCAVNAFL